MARIVGVDLPQNKRIEVALTYVFGVGRPRSKRILEKAGVDVSIKVKDLAEDEVRKIRDIIQEEGQVEGDLRKNIQMDIKRMIDIGCYKGLRHRRSLPVHGQRTHTNARTRKGPRKTVAGKKKAPGGKKG